MSCPCLNAKFESQNDIKVKVVHKALSIPTSFLLYTAQWCEKDVGLDKVLYTTFTFIISIYLVCILFAMPSLLLHTF